MMKGKNKRLARTSAALDTLASAGKTNTKFIEKFVNDELATVLKARKLKKCKLQRAIVSHMKSGVVISGPVSVPKKRAKSDRLRKLRPVGFILNTMRLVDPVSRRALSPGVALVEMRLVRGDRYAFDFIGSDGKVKLATNTHRPHPFGGSSDLGAQPPGGQAFDIEINHVLRAPTADDLLPCDYICTSYHDGTETCYYACDGDEDLGFTIVD
ncbi:MAG: hypothetical protein AAGF81_17505 [Pseudomonadota bacterium]